MNLNKMFSEMAKQSYEFAEICSRGAKGEFLPENHDSAVGDTIKDLKRRWFELAKDMPDGFSPIATDPEAWRAEYLAKQAAGVKFEYRWIDGKWVVAKLSFCGNKEDYREVPQEVKQTWTAIDTAKFITPTIPHLKERILWLQQREAGTNEVWQYFYSAHWIDLPAEDEPFWRPGMKYRVKPKTVTYYMAMLKRKGTTPYGRAADNKESIIEYASQYGWEIIGNIETREVPIE